MAEPVENGMVVSEHGEKDVGLPDVPLSKAVSEQEPPPKQNGLKDHTVEEMDTVDDGNKDETSASHVNGSNTRENLAEAKSENEISHLEDKESEIIADKETPQGSDKPAEETIDSKEKSGKESDNKSKDTADKAEVMEIDDDSNIGASNSAQDSDVIEVDGNNSQSPSVVTEDSSRDSVYSGDSRPNSANPDKQSLVGTVKDDDGADILITLNEEEDNEKTVKVEDDKVGDEKEVSDDKEACSGEKKEEDKDASSSSKTENVTVSSVSDAANSNSASVAKNSLLTSSTGISLVSATPTTVKLPVVSMPFSQTVVLQSGISPPIIQQGQQYGYVAKIGNQNVFVPVSTIPAPVVTRAYTAVSSQLNTLQASQAAPPLPSSAGSSGSQSPSLEDLTPKSSMEMVELMKWEVQNRIPDNYNWSVAFHPKKEELSSITSFLLDLGHDVVKEAVYKDIIQIQTKKKENNELKSNEIESLEKMKTVYDNTKKKVKHLQLPIQNCDGCDFKTESSVVMENHKDYPHYDPPWDTNHGWMQCPRCTFRTKVMLQFSMHMESMHNAKGKQPEKLNYFQCELCPLNTNTKNKIDKHRQKCIKHFKLNVNLQPYYHDVNFIMKTCYYKPRKPITKASPQPVKPAPKPSPTMQTRQHGGALTAQQIILQQQQQHQQAIRQRIPQVAGRPPALQQRPTQYSGVQNQVRPGVQRPPPALQARPSLQSKATRPPGKEMMGFEVCELCGGYVKDRQALRIHFYYAHKVEMPQAIFTRPNPPLTCDVCQNKFWTTQGLSKHKSTTRHFTSSTPGIQNPVKPSPGTNQKCFMCARKVLNLFVHIETVHGMTMKDLVAMKKCIMCGITAADRRQLEVHMASAHGVLIKANDILSSDNTKRTPLQHQQSNVPSVPDKGVKPVGRLNFCVFCQIQFADNIQLTMHCIKIHATCRGCGMVVATSKHLASHNCKQVKRNCVICGQREISADDYAGHMKKHVKPCKVRIDRLTEKEISDVKDKIKREYKPQVISLDSDEESEVEVVENTNPSKTEAGKKIRVERRPVVNVDSGTKDSEETKKDNQDAENKEVKHSDSKEKIVEDRDKSSNEKENKTRSDEREEEHIQKADVENEKKEESGQDELSNDETSNSNDGFTSGKKRKKSDSDGDEVELLQDEDSGESKRLKLDETRGETIDDSSKVESQISGDGEMICDETRDGESESKQDETDKGESELKQNEMECAESELVKGESESRQTDSVEGEGESKPEEMEEGD